MKLGIVTDSTCDLPAHLAEQYSIEVVPSILIIDGQSYPDGVGITREEFYVRLPVMKSTPTTSSPSVGEFQERYERQFRSGADEILSIHPPAVLSGIFNAARLAAESYDGKVKVYDSGSLSLGIGFQVLAAAEAADSGADMEQTLAVIESTRKRLVVNAALDTVEYVRRSGRVPTAVGMLGSLLSIKPFVDLRESEVKFVGVTRTTHQANEKMLHNLLEICPLERLAVLHTNAEPRARGLLNGIMERASQSVPREILMVNVTTVIGTHVGPNGLGFAAVRK